MQHQIDVLLEFFVGPVREASCGDLAVEAEERDESEEARKGEESADGADDDELGEAEGGLLERDGFERGGQLSGALDSAHAEHRSFKGGFGFVVCKSVKEGAHIVETGVEVIEKVAGHAANVDFHMLSRDGGDDDVIRDERAVWREGDEMDAGGDSGGGAAGGVDALGGGSEWVAGIDQDAVVAEASEANRLRLAGEGAAGYELGAFPTEERADTTVAITGLDGRNDTEEHASGSDAGVEDLVGQRNVPAMLRAVELPLARAEGVGPGSWTDSDASLLWVRNEGIG